MNIGEEILRFSAVSAFIALWALWAEQWSPWKAIRGVVARKKSQGPADVRISRCTICRSQMRVHPNADSNSKTYVFWAQCGLCEDKSTHWYKANMMGVRVSHTTWPPPEILLNYNNFNKHTVESFSTTMRDPLIDGHYKNPPSVGCYWKPMERRCACGWTTQEARQLPLQMPRSTAVPGNGKKISQ